jgi:hypothetical protein
VIQIYNKRPVLARATKAELPPQNLEAERAVLGAILLEGHRFAEVVELLTREDFYLPSHADIFDTMLDLHSRDDAITLITVEDSLQRAHRAIPAPDLADLASIEHTDPLIGRNARIISERARARTILDRFSEIEASIRAGSTSIEDLEKLQFEIAAFASEVNSATKNGKLARIPLMERISEVARESVTWLWQDRIPMGKLTMIEGDPGLGKSWLCLAIAAAVSRGYGLPGNSKSDPGDVLLMTAEDGLGDTVRPRLEEMAADLTKIIALRCFKNEAGREQAVTLDELDIIEKAIVIHRPRLVIVDPIIAFIAGTDTSKANEVRGILSPVAGLAQKHGAAIITVRHLNKGAARAFYRGQGSIDFLAACRSAFVVGENPENSEERIFCHFKSNLAPKSPSLGFRIVNGRFGWTGESTLTADEILTVAAPGEKKTDLDDAKDFLKSVLGDGPLPSTEIVKQAGAAGIAERTLWRAKGALKVRARKGSFGGNWSWNLDTEACQEPPKSANNATGAEMADLAAFDGDPHDQKDGWEEV